MKFFQTAAKVGIGARTQTQWLSIFYRTAGIYINKLTISKSKIHIDKNHFIQTEAQQIRDKEMARMSNLNLALHFDTKKVEKVQENFN